MMVNMPHKGNLPGRKIGFAVLAGLMLILSAVDVYSQSDHLTVTTWNIEKLGGNGRGLAGGYGKANLGPRTPEQLTDIAHLIHDKLHSDILALQEISITDIDGGVSVSQPLETIRAALGDSWRYYIQEVDAIPAGQANLFCAFLWNTATVNLIKAFPMNLPDYDMAGAGLFDRQPLVGYFKAVVDSGESNDFVLINVHLKSGQTHDENHVIAMVELEYEMTKEFKEHGFRESDRIILGDFNDNPYAVTAAGNQAYSDALYDHMKFKKYQDLVTPDFHSTRMDSELKSVIDHILVNNSAKRHIPNDKAEIYLPGDPSTFAAWRKTYSDHFPLSFRIDISHKDDDAD